ncbi:MAG: bifunctional riboflavin kinase/FMN adenylyltransferase [Phycisphaeraceae bacterium]
MTTEPTRRSVITIGNFDGVHIGHRAILRVARALADEHRGASGGGSGGVEVIAMPFDPHPATRLAPERVPPRLTSRAERARLLRAVGADRVVFLEPDQRTLGMDAGAFVNDLVEKYRPVGFVEGPDFRFGRARQGDLALLREMGRAHDFVVRVAEPVEVALHDRWGHRAGSSLARWLIGHGRVEDAARVLGRAYSVVSTVVAGDRRGRAIGFPTINLSADEIEGFIIPADGVYAGEAEIEGEASAYPAAISVGVKPTFGGHDLTLEAHLIGLDHEVYDRRVELSFTRWVRDQRAFPGLEALVEQLGRDVGRVREWADRGELSPVAGDAASLAARLSSP